jgi:hypothetical protein
MKTSPQRASIKYKNQEWLLEGAARRRGLRFASIARSKTHAMGRTAKFVVFHYESPGVLENLLSNLELTCIVTRHILHDSPIAQPIF